MLYHKNIINISIIVSVLLFTRCATSYAPDNYLPAPEEVPQNVYGGWLTLIVAADTLENEKWLEYSGEFISSDESFVCLLYDSLYQIPHSIITSSTLELTTNNSTGYGIWVTLGVVSTLSNGVYAAITAPLWLLAGIPAVVGESVRDRYEAENPSVKYWNEVRKFSRFPQGITNINLNQIKQIKIIEENIR